MSEMLRKRSREPENLPNSTDVRERKRFHVEEMDQFHHLLLLDKTLAAAEEECAPSEEVVNGVMRSLEEEIGVNSYPSSNFGVDWAAYDKSSGHEGQTLASDSGIDLIYLLEASDDELGIPLSPVLDLKDEVCQSTKETSECLFNNPDLESLENWHFEDDFESYTQLAWYEDASDASQPRDYMNRDFICQDLFFEGDFSAAWTLETTCCI